MKKGLRKGLIVCLILCLAAASLGALTACKKTVDYSRYHVLFLGDSIAEGIAGPAPIEDRAGYSYFSILGQINGYYYENRAVSGNQTKEFLEYISRPADEDAYIPRTLIGQADVICISITGNDLLWNNFPLMLFEIAAREKYGDDYVNRPEVKECYEFRRYQVVTVADGHMRLITNDDDVEHDPSIRMLQPGDGIATFDRVIREATANVDAIVRELRRQNPKATIIFQNVYNPVDDESEIIPTDLVADMMRLDPKYDFSTESGVAEFRRLGGYMLGTLSGILENCADKNDNVEFLDVAAVFDEIYRTHREEGKDLIFVDGVHPSDRGHAVIAAALQDKLISLGFAEGKHSLAKYKQMRVEQLERAYRGVQGFDFDAVAASIDAASDMLGVARAYFDGVAGYNAKLYTDPTAGRVTNGVAVGEDVSYTLCDVRARRADEAAQQQISDYVSIASDMLTKKELTFHTDGTLDIVLELPKSLLPAVKALLGDNMVLGGIEDTFYKSKGGTDKNGKQLYNYTNLKLAGAQDAFLAVKAYADALFPGIDMLGGHFGRNFSMLYGSLGIAIEGIEALTDVPYTDAVGLPRDMAPAGTVDESTIGKTYESYLDYAVAYMARYQEVTDEDGKVLHVSMAPPNLSAALDSLGLTGSIRIRVRTTYSLVTVKSAANEHVTVSGDEARPATEFWAAYCGQYRERTSPWMVITRVFETDAYDETTEYMRLNFEVLGMTIWFRAE